MDFGEHSGAGKERICKLLRSTRSMAGGSTQPLIISSQEVATLLVLPRLPAVGKSKPLARKEKNPEVLSMSP